MHRLPTEIFLYLITEVLTAGIVERPRSHHDTHLGRLVNYYIVCKRWKEIIETTPSFWTTINLLDPPALSALAVTRSANLPLTVIALPGGTSLPQRWPEFKNLMLKNSKSWRSAEIAIPWSAELDDVLGADLPVLESLTLRTRSPYLSQVSTAQKVFQMVPRRLVRLALHGIAIPWTLQFFRHLKFLSLTGLHAFSPTCDELLGVLKECSGLVELELDLEEPTEETQTRQDPGPPFTLPQLTSVSLFLYPSFLVKLFETISAPSLQTFSALLDFEEAWETLIPSVVETTRGLFSNVIRTEHRSKMSILDNNNWKWECEPITAADSGRNFGIQTQWRLTPLEAAEAFFIPNDKNPHSPESIEIVIVTKYDLELSDFLQKLDKVPRVHSFSISHYDVDPLFTYMANPTTTDDWGFPELQDLILHDCGYNAMELVNMLSARYGVEGSDGSQNSQAERELPPSLEWLSILHAPGEAEKGILSQAEEIVGPSRFELNEDLELSE
ncbi:hypothetical protein FRB90_011001 [Tulasnella sp. 427]|nr:hypothetical protein FRB90_011001 [Tulasnella sp. 427]